MANINIAYIIFAFGIWKIFEIIALFLREIEILEKTAYERNRKIMWNRNDF